MNLTCECGNDEAILEVAFHTDYVWLCVKCLDKYFPSGGAEDYAKKQGAVQEEKADGYVYQPCRWDMEPSSSEAWDVPEVQSAL